MTFFQILITIIKSLIIIVPVLISVAFFTLLERKVPKNAYLELLDHPDIIIL